MTRFNGFSLWQDDCVHVLCGGCLRRENNLPAVQATMRFGILPERTVLVLGHCGKCVAGAGLAPRFYDIRENELHPPDVVAQLRRTRAALERVSGALIRCASEGRISVDLHDELQEYLLLREAD